MHRLLEDIHQALRVMRSAPGFMAVAVLVLTIGIGTTTTMFSVVNGVLLKPLGYRDPGTLVAISSGVPANPDFALSAYYFAQWRARSQTIDSMAAVSFGTTPTLVSGRSDPERVRAVRVSANLFSLLGIPPQLGRSFQTAEEQDVASSRVVILSDGFWSRRFGRDPKILGATIQLTGQSYEVVGIMPPGFRFPKNDELHRMIRMPDQVDIWTPLVFSPQEIREYLYANYAGIARLKPGVTLSAAQAELNGIIEQSPMPRVMAGVKFRLSPLQTEMVARVRQGLIVLMSAVALVFMISCVNFTNLLIARAANLRHEIAVRSALGATRLQLARIAIAESLVVSAFGAAGGALLATWLIDLVRANTIRLPRVDEIAFDVRSLVFTIAATFVSAAICGAAPAWRYSRTDPAEALHDTSRTASSGRVAGRFRAGLVSVQSALCVVLTIIAGLLIHSFMNSTGLDQGFKAENVFTTSIQLYGQQYIEPAAKDAFFTRVFDAFRALPGTQAIGGVSSLPLSGQTNIMGLSPETSDDVFSGGVQAEYRTATRGYFEAMNIPLLRGELFQDRADGPKVALITEQTAKRLWPGRDPIGHRFMRRNRDEVFTVVGIVGNVRTANPENEPSIVAYTPYAREPLGGFTLVIRTTAAAPAIRQAVASIDKTLAVSRIRKIDELVSEAFAERRFQMLLLTSFAGISIVLAAIGLYGVVSASVAQRQKEIGIRLALGAERRSISTMVLREGLTPVLLGMAAGLVVAALAAQAMRSLLFSVTPLDLASYAGGLLTLLAAAIAACCLPMRAATRVDPMLSIRYE